MRSSAFTFDRFSNSAPQLRQHFEDRLGQPKETRNDRFVWDFWHVPDQYTLVRTPAYHFFPDPLYMKFHKELVEWGRRNLGCWDVTPPWLSYYIDGCKQELHSDVPHGPWAFVFSLSPKKIRYQGGETLILRPQVLNYWKNFGREQDRERSSFIENVKSPFNRLTVFDPRYPHGVSEVSGTMDPLQARLVIHGWFTQPKTYTNGYLPSKSTEKILNQAFSRVEDCLAAHPALQGTVSLNLQVTTSGSVKKAQFLTNTLMTTEGETPQALHRELLKIYGSLQFASARGPTEITIPLIFR
jgi:hypothetical protein